MVRLSSLAVLLWIVFYVASITVSDNLGLQKIEYNEMVLGVS